MTAAADRISGASSRLRRRPTSSRIGGGSSSMASAIRSHTPSGASVPLLASSAATSGARPPRRGSGGSPAGALDRRGLVGVDRVEAVGAQQLLDLVVRELGHDCSPAGRRPTCQLRAQPPQAGPDPALHRALGLLRARRRPRGRCGRRSRRARSPAAPRRQRRHRLLDLVERRSGPTPRARGRSRPRRCAAASRSSRRRRDVSARSRSTERPWHWASRYERRRAAARVELLGLVPQPEEHLLHDLLGQRGVVEQAPGQAEHRAGVAPVRLGQRVLLVPADRA